MNCDSELARDRNFDTVRGMKKLALVFIIGFAFACGGKKKQEATTTDPNTSVSSGSGDTSGSATGEGVECAKEIALVCPDGQIDGCLKTPAEGTTHKCVAK